MLGGLIILFFTLTSSVVRGLTRYDNNTCFDQDVRKYFCCSNYEEINDECFKCKLGFRSRKGTSCEPCEFDFFGEGCAYQCMCNVTQGCDKVNGCVEKYAETTRIPTTQSNMAKAISSEESFTKVHEEKETEGLSKTELQILFCGAFAGIIVLLGFFGILICVKKRIRIRMSKSKRDKPTEVEVHTSDEHGTQEDFVLNESLYETIDDSHLDSILVPQTCNPNLDKDDESQSSGSSANCDDDRSSYLEPISSPITKKSSFQRKEQSQKTFHSARKSTCIENVYKTIDDSHLDSMLVTQTCSHTLEKDDESSSSGSSTNCNDDRSIYLQPLGSLIEKDSSCHTEEHSRNIFPSANKSTCIEDQTSCNPYPAIEEDDSSSEFSEDAVYDRSSYLHPYNTLVNKTSSCHIYEI